MRKRLLSTALVVIPGFLLGTFAGAWAANAVVSITLSPPPDPDPTPAIVLPLREQDLGHVSAGTVLRASFPIKNTGSRRLVLWEESSVCCGESGQARQVILQPGQSTDLVVEVDTSLWDGQVHEAVRYRANDPQMPQFTLTVVATVDSSQSEDGPI